MKYLNIFNAILVGECGRYIKESMILTQAEGFKLKPTKWSYVGHMMINYDKLVFLKGILGYPVLRQTQVLFQSFPMGFGCPWKSPSTA